MPRWVQHSKSLLSWRKRYRLNTDPTEVLSGILPTSQLDKDWPQDTLDLWGLYIQSRDNPAGNEYLGAELVAQRKELLVHRIRATMLIGASAGPLGQGCHVMTPLQTYDPTVNVPTIWFPWFQSGYRAGQAANLPEAFGLGGTNPALQVVVINGVPFTSLGPVSFQSYATAVGQPQLFNIDLWTHQDPPLRVHPFQSCCVQTIQPATGGGSVDTLNVNFWFSERDPQI